MEENEKKVPDVKFINSVALACNDMDEQLRHFQITIVQDTETKEFRAFFDVVDPSKIKLAEQ